MVDVIFIGNLKKKLEAREKQLKKINQVLQDANISLEKVEGTMESVHFSGGYVHGNCELSYDLRLMMHQADALLYASKKEGKDRIAHAVYSREYAKTLQDSAGSGKWFME